MQAIIYVLGMDGVLQQGQRVPLPPAMTEALEDEAGLEHQVLESGIEPTVVLRSIADVPSPLGCQLVAERLRHLASSGRGRNLARIVLPGSARN